MLQLQRRVAHPDGVLRARSALPHGAHVVRSFFEQEPFEEHVLRFNVSRLRADERVLGAELRVFRLRRTRAPLLVEGGRGAGAGADEHRLLGVQATSARAPPAWHSFNVAAAVRAWLAGDAPNLGLLVTASALDGGPAHAPAFARRHRHAPRRQPLLVLYDAEGPAAPPDPNAGPPAFSPPSENEVDAEDEDEEAEYDDEESAEGGAGEERRGGRARRAAPWSGPRRRRRRHGTSQQQQPAAAAAANATGDGDGGVCARQDLWVEFDEIGWSSWIISPAGYNAFQCAGACPYPVGPALNPTNHATVQSIVHALGLQAHARAPCCAPDRLEGLSLLYTNDQGDVVLKIYEDMVASTCACH
ncbi:Protein decapentaplegic [Gryllus bimaculatus]|nr:Protein decapentaplegic [Gryllus bimaculatus]